MSEQTKVALRRPSYETNVKHSADPQPGDYWHEMFCPIAVVVARIGKLNVLVCKKTKAADHNSWTWDLDSLDVMKIQDFETWLRYSNHDGFWADCAPESHKWVTEEVAA